jgi:hypothetical protein
MKQPARTPNWKDKAGQVVTLDGVLVSRERHHTQVNCGSPEECCNTYVGNLALQIALDHVWLVDMKASGFNCYGDQTAMCCGLTAGGGAIVAEGQLVVRNDGPEHRYNLIDVRLCRIAQTNGVTDSSESDRHTGRR